MNTRSPKLILWQPMSLLVSGIFTDLFPETVEVVTYVIHKIHGDRKFNRHLSIRYHHATHENLFNAISFLYLKNNLLAHISIFFLLMGEGSSVSRQFDLLVWYCDVGCQIYRRYLHFLGFYIMADDNCHMTITWSTYYNIILWSLKWI